MMNNFGDGKFLGVLGILLMVSACSVTTDSTKSSSESFESTSEASTEVTSSTSPKGDDNDTKRLKITEFSSNNFERLREDMAAGGGEYLTSLAALLEIPESMQPAFFEFTRGRFSTWVVSSQTTSDQLIIALTADLAKHREFSQ